MFIFINKFFKKKKIKQFIEQNKISIDKFHGGLNINGLVVKEFSYLISYISNGTINNFYDFNKIYQNKDMLLTNIDKECAKNILAEEDLFHISHKLAIRNQNNLKNIITIIYNLVDMHKKLNLDYAEIENNLK